MVELFKKKEKPVAEKTKAEERTEEVADIMQKFRAKLDTNLKEKVSISDAYNASKTPGSENEPFRTKEYTDFASEYKPKVMSWYEKCCAFSERYIKVVPDEQKKKEYEEAIKTTHLNVTPTGISSFAVVGPLIFVLIMVLLSVVLFNSLFFVMFFTLMGVAAMRPLQKAAIYMANNWRMKASNQMVLCIFYVVTYMRHTSNLENAIQFAGEHLAPPMSVDLKKVIWDVETQKFESIKESLDDYLSTWKRWNMEFVESMHLIEASLYESAEDRRIGMLDKSLDVILEGTYEKMLHYAQNLKQPLTMINMLGVILPILGLVILPLVVSFMCQAKWYHLAALYNIGLFTAVYYLSKNVLATRPTGYGDADISEENPEFEKYKKIAIRYGKKEIRVEPLYIALVISAVFFALALSPLFLHLVTPEGWDISLLKNAPSGANPFVIGVQSEQKDTWFTFLGYKTSKGCEGVDVGLPIGPYGLGASLMSLMFVVASGVALGLYYKLKSEKLIKIRQETKKLEDEFASALFQLGNRLGDGLPAEIAFQRVAETMEGSTSGNFFKLVSSNITRLGMGVDQAIFDPQYGALVFYPSNLIRSSMKVLAESSKKGPRIAAQALINVSRYIKEIHRVNERLKDLMADIVGSMKSQISFLTPVISGIVVGITSMITTILGKLTGQLQNIQSGAGAEGAGGNMALLTMFGDSVPTYYFQIMVGFYVVQIIYILSVMTNGIENGSDSLNENFMVGNNLVKSSMMYIIICAIIVLLFNLLATTILKSI